MTATADPDIEAASEISISTFRGTGDLNFYSTIRPLKEEPDLNLAEN